MTVRRVVATGLGIAAPNGLGTENYWTATLRSVVGIRPISRFDATTYPVKLAGEVRGFEPAEHLPSRLIPQTDHMTRLALAAAAWALADAGVDLRSLPDYDAGVVTASSCGGFEFGQRELENLWGGHRHTSAPISPSPGSTRSTRARSRSGMACAGQAACWSPTTPAGWMPSVTPGA